MSKYDKIKTAAELISEVMVRGLSTAQDDICRAQDILGHSSIEELASLANDIGRNNENGEPDPKGTWSSGRKPTRNTFYSIVFSIWNWEDACRFWNEHTNPQTEQFNEMRCENRRLAKENESLSTRRDELLKSDAEWGRIFSEKSKQLADTEQSLREANEEIIKLKARLYDLLCNK